MNKSEELAKILGLVKDKQCCYYWGCPYFNWSIQEDLKIEDKDCDKCNNPNRFKYPDFTKPSNFVKLLELLFETDAWLLNRSLDYTENENSFVNNFLAELVFELINRPINYKTKLVIKQAQQTEWEE